MKTDANEKHTHKYKLTNEQKRQTKHYFMFQ